MFDDGEPILEVFLIDFHGDLYGREIEVEFIDFVRKDAKFQSVESLKEQMAKDVTRTRVILREAPEQPRRLAAEYGICTRWKGMPLRPLEALSPSPAACRIFPQRHSPTDHNQSRAGWLHALFSPPASSSQRVVEPQQTTEQCTTSATVCFTHVSSVAARMQRR